MQATRYLIFSLLISTMVICGGCASPKIITNNTSTADKSFRSTRTTAISAQGSAIQAANLSQQTSSPRPSDSITLSPGDKVQITIPEGEEFSGIFEIDLDGSLHLPYLKPIIARGRTIDDLTLAIHQVLIIEGIFKQQFLSVTVSPVQWAPSNIIVKGSVYNPGNIMINERNYNNDFNPVNAQSGDFAHKRSLSSALKAAGGLRPDADLRNISLIRNNQTYIVDMSGILSGNPVNNPPLTSGDQIIIPSVGYLQTELMRPSIVTPPGFRVYLSNLTIPADSNNKASNNKFASSLPPGARLLKGAMSANCVGGTASVNAKRHVILVGIDPMTSTTRVLQRSLSELIAEPNNDHTNPYLLPEDSIACYDSGMTNARDISRAIADFLRPFAILSGGVL